jgi:hypothetical protein
MFEHVFVGHYTFDKLLNKADACLKGRSFPFAMC